MNLYQASRHYFRKSELAMIRGMSSSAVLLVLTLFALRPFGDWEDALLILAIACVQLLQMWFKYRTLYWASKADVPRRMDQLKSGLGIEASAERCASIEQEIGKCDNAENPNYWRSIQPTGPRRMMEMILESSFYTRSLAATCRNIFFTMGSIGLGLVAAVLIVSYRISTTDKPNEFIQHVVLSVLIFFLTGDFWTVGLLYSDLNEAADNCHKQAYALLKSGNINQDIALEFALDYNTAVVQGPPLLSFKYFKSRDVTDETFVRSFGKLLGL